MRGIEMFAIQWYDPYMPKHMLPYKDGKPRGNFESKEAAESKAEFLLAVAGADIPYEIVEIK